MTALLLLVLLLGPAAATAGSPSLSAARWLLSRRRADSGWGSFTPRAVVALALAEEGAASPQEWELVTKQLRLMLALEVERGVEKMGLSRLALYVNALLATCDDPRHFEGRDLVRALRAETDAHLRPPPSVFIPLCLAGETAPGDLSALSTMYRESANSTDLQAIQLLAMSCLSREASVRPGFDAYLQDFTARFQASRNTLDVYTKALALQAIQSGTVDDSLSSQQREDGSFEDSLLATYHAIPALQGTSLLDLGHKCRAHPRQHEAGLPSRPVQMSLWVGSGLERDTHTAMVSVPSNGTVLDALRAASLKSDVFRFSCDASPSSGCVRLFSLSGIPNDAERQLSWRLYLRQRDSSRLRQVLGDAVDRVSAESTVVFWFKRD